MRLVCHPCMGLLCTAMAYHLYQPGIIQQEAVLPGSPIRVCRVAMHSLRGWKAIKIGLKYGKWTRGDSTLMGKGWGVESPPKEDKRIACVELNLNGINCWAYVNEWRRIILSSTGCRPLLIHSLMSSFSVATVAEDCRWCWLVFCDYDGRGAHYPVIRLIVQH